MAGGGRSRQVYAESQMRASQTIGAVIPKCRRYRGPSRRSAGKSDPNGTLLLSEGKGGGSTLLMKAVNFVRGIWNPFILHA
jgi:hypothetical protein